MSERIGVVGSREYPDLELVRLIIDGFEAGTVIVTGGARGVDTIAEKHGKTRGFKVVVYRPQYDKYGIKAPHVRNQRIIADIDRLLAFHDGMSRGTLNMIQLARKRQMPCEIHAPRRSLVG